MTHTPTHTSIDTLIVAGMLQAYSQPTVTDNNPISQNNDSISSVAVNLNTNSTSASCFHSSKANNNNSNNNNNNNNSNNNNSNALTLNSVSNNPNVSTTSSVASLYQNNPFDLQPTQIYAHHRLLQAQQHQQNNNAAGLFPDYAAVMARYAYHWGGGGWGER